MKQPLLVTVLIAAFSTLAWSDEGPNQELDSYPIKLDTSHTREFSSLKIDFANVTLKGDSMIVVPILIQPGVTGAVLIGNGTYSFAPEAGKSFEGKFRAAMLRFNPNDQDAIIKLESGKLITDKGAGELARRIVEGTFRHCYHSGMEALIPPASAFAANLYAQEGDLLISVDGKNAVDFNFSDRSQVYNTK